MIWLSTYLAVGLVAYVLMRYAYAREYSNVLRVREHALIVGYGLVWPAALALFLVFDRLAARAEREQS